MKSRCQRALIGLLTAGALALPVMNASAAAKPAPAKGGNAAAGKAAFSKEGCTGCHKAKDYPKGGEVGPDLSTIGGSKKVAEITAYIKKPKAGSVMPAFKGPQATLDSLGAYLATQK